MGVDFRYIENNYDIVDYYELMFFAKYDNHNDWMNFKK